MTAHQHNILLETGTNELEIVEFGVQFNDREGDQRTQALGINVTKVREIIRMPELTQLPNMADGVRGVLNLREQVIPAIDLGYLLHGEALEENRGRMIVTEFNGIRIAFIVASVNRIHRISWSDVIPPTSIHNVDPSYSAIVGIVTFEDRNIMMLDAEKIVAQLEPALAMNDETVGFGQFGKGLTALAVEDSTLIQRLVNKHLRAAGFNVLEFQDGLSAWIRLREYGRQRSEGSPGEEIHLVVSDIEMPRMDGYTLIRHIREHEHLSHLPIILFSSMINEDNWHRGEVVGADVQLAKPIISDLLESARKVLTERHIIS